MFFTGLFSTHIPYIIMVAVYSLSFGIYSVYYINNKTHNNKKAEKEVNYYDYNEITESDFDFHDYASSEKVDQRTAISVFFRPGLKSFFEKIKLFIISPGRIFYHGTCFSLFSRPPPLY